MNFLITSDAFHSLVSGYVIYFIATVIIVPIIYCIKSIYDIGKENNQYNYNAYSKTDRKELERQKDLNTLLSVRNKIEQGFGVESFSKEEFRILNKYNIDFKR